MGKLYLVRDNSGLTSFTSDLELAKNIALEKGDGTVVELTIADSAELVFGGEDLAIKKKIKEDISLKIFDLVLFACEARNSGNDGLADILMEDSRQLGMILNLISLDDLKGALDRCLESGIMAGELVPKEAWGLLLNQME